MRSEVRKAILLFMIVYVAWQILYLVASAYPSLYDNWLLAYLAVLVVILCFFVFDKQRAEDLGLRRIAFWKRTITIALVFAVVYELYWVALGVPIFGTMPVRFVSHSVFSIPYNLALAVVVGLVEETSFRGYILKHLSGIYSDPKAIAYSSILFGLYHFPLVPSLMEGFLETLTYWTLYVLAGIVVGVFLGYFYLNTQKTTLGTITYHSSSIFFESLVPFTLATSLIVNHLLATSVYLLFIPVMVILRRRHVMGFS